jgi:hypothetical protein
MADTKLHIFKLGILGAAFLSGSLLVAAPDARPVTFAKDIAPIFQEKCQDCHRKGSMAPMSLVTYEETRPWAKAIRERVVTRQMPPWHIDRNVGVQNFKNDLSLSDAQIATIVRWIDSGEAPGDPKDMPPAKQWPSGNEWTAAKELGKPDMIIEAPAYTMEAHHQDVWWRPVVKIPIDEPRWVKAVEMRPSSEQGRRIIHHAVAYLDQEEPGEANSPDRTAASGGRGMLMEWAIGKQYDMYRPNTGKLLLPGSQISWDVHIHAVGDSIRSGVQLGIWFYPKGQEPKYRTYLTALNALPRGRLDIPPNTVTENEGFTVLKQAAVLGNIQPHMHLRGKAMMLEAILPDGTTQVVSYVSHFNFNWMTNYIYADDAAPMFPKGTVIHVIAWHDNTAANKANPDPEQWVGYGDRTVDEMAHAWVNITYVSDDDYKEWAAKHKPAQTSRAAQ